MSDTEGILSVLLARTFDIFNHQHDTVLRAVDSYLDRISRQFNLNYFLLLKNIKIEICPANAKEVRMMSSIMLNDGYGRPYNIKPDVSMVKLSDIPRNLHSRISDNCVFDATPEIVEKVAQAIPEWR